MEWVVKLEAKSGWGEVETIEVGRLQRRVVGLTGEEVGLTLAEGKNLLGELARLILQTQMEEFTTCARVCRDCLKLRRTRDRRTRKIFFSQSRMSDPPLQSPDSSRIQPNAPRFGGRKLVAAQRFLPRTPEMVAAKW